MARVCPRGAEVDSQGPWPLVEAQGRESPVARVCPKGAEADSQGPWPLVEAQGRESPVAMNQSPVRCSGLPQRGRG